MQNATNTAFSQNLALESSPQSHRCLGCTIAKVVSNSSPWLSGFCKWITPGPEAITWTFFFFFFSMAGVSSSQLPQGGWGRWTKPCSHLYLHAAGPVASPAWHFQSSKAASQLPIPTTTDISRWHPSWILGPPWPCDMASSHIILYPLPGTATALCKPSTPAHPPVQCPRTKSMQGSIEQRSLMGPFPVQVH